MIIMTFRVVSTALKQSYDCHNVTEATPKGVVKFRRIPLRKNGIVTTKQIITQSYTYVMESTIYYTF